MRQSSNLGLALYDKTDLMNITGLENSLNHNMELIDSEISQLSQNKASLATQQTVEATSVGARRALHLTADNLQATINALPRLLTEAIEIYVSGTITDVIQIRNFYGSGDIIIRARNVGDAIFKKNLIVSNCTVVIRLINLVFEDNADAITAPIQNGLLDVLSCRSVSVESCTFTGTSNNCPVKTLLVPIQPPIMAALAP